MTRTPDHLMDPAAVWDSLSPELQRQAGIAAVILSVSDIALTQSSVTTELAGGFEAAFEEAHLRLEFLLEAELPRPLQRPDLACIEVRACEACGCTDVVGCSGGCTWVAERRCSNCMPELLQ